MNLPLSLPSPLSIPTNYSQLQLLPEASHALLEIIETEHGYLLDLRRLEQFYLAKIDAAATLKIYEKHIIKRNIAQLIELAERFSRRISIAIGGTQQLERWKNKQEEQQEQDLDRIIERVAKAFISESPIFTIYEEYCARHTEAADLIRSFESTPEWNPIQRIMRYPMLLNSLLNQINQPSPTNPLRARAIERVQQALWAMKQVAEGVDEAKSLREVELKTELIASRMELHSSYRAAFVCLLGQIKLVGSLHILYHAPSLDPSEAFKIKYHGIFLYQTHLVIVKVKRATVYEPRHWFPIRYFDLIDISDSSGLMPHSFSLKYRQHTFEFGATCEPEKRCWMNKLRELKLEIEQLRSIQIMSAMPISDDSIVSSISLLENPNPSPIEPPTRDRSPVEEDQPACDEPVPTTPVAPATQSRVSQRLSRNVNTLLGRTAEVAQAAIDLKLTEIFSDVLLHARLQDSGAESGGARARTLSATGTTSAKRTHTAHAAAIPRNAGHGNGGDRKMKRMSCMEPNIRPREMLPPPPLPRIFNPSSDETPWSGSPSSSLRRARSGPALVSRSSSSLPQADLDDATVTSQPLPALEASQQAASAEELLPGCLRCPSPDQEEHSSNKLGPNDPVLAASTKSTGSTPLWLPGLKMVRRLSRVGTRSKKDADADPLDPKATAPPSLLVDPAKRSIHSRQASTPHPTTAAANAGEHSSSEYCQNTFRRVFMKRNRSSASSSVAGDSRFSSASPALGLDPVAAKERQGPTSLRRPATAASSVDPQTHPACRTYADHHDPLTKPS
ncbi:hypothetical protein PtB15_1B298 [Puccinia triticina]|nr:hypothetical protein PtB15_1B298 [Puccinia triticina]